MGAVKIEHLPHYTYEDYKHFEGDWELVDGIAYAMAPAPIVTHQAISANIIFELKNIFAKCKKCLVVHESDWHLADDTILRPDVLMICKEVQEHIDKTPEIVFEVISPSTVRRDEGQKFELYESEGVQYYAMVYPERRVVKLYHLREGRFIKVGDYDNDLVPLHLNDCESLFDFSKIWR